MGVLRARICISNCSHVFLGGHAEGKGCSYLKPPLKLVIKNLVSGTVMQARSHRNFVTGALVAYV